MPVGERFGRNTPHYDALRMLTLQGGASHVAPTKEVLGLGGNKIIVYHTSGLPLEFFDPNEAGVNAAIAAALAGDTIWLPSVEIAMSAGITIPDGVAMRGIDELAILNFSGFSGAAVTIGDLSIIEDFKIIFESNGTTAIGVDARASNGLIEEVVIDVSGGNASNIGILAGVSGASQTLQQYSKKHSTSGGGGTFTDDPTTTWGINANQWSTNSPGNSWHYIIFKLTKDLDLPQGGLKAIIVVESATGLKDVALMDPTLADATATPFLSGDSTGISGGVPPGTYTLTAGSPVTYPSDGIGYFAVKIGWPAFNASFRISKVIWRETDAPNTETTLWDETVDLVASGFPTIFNCRDVQARGAGSYGIQVSNSAIAINVRARGDTSDVTIDAGGTLYAHLLRHDSQAGSGVIEPLAGDRSAWNMDYFARHASDIADEAPVYHVPSAADNTGKAPVSDGSKWVATDITTQAELDGHEADPSAHHAPVTLAGDAGAVLGLSGQELNLDAQSANTVFAGPASGTAADPAFRTLVAADIPAEIARVGETGTNHFHIIGEQRTGDGSTVTFQTDNEFEPYTLAVFVVGARQTVTEDAGYNSFTLSAAPTGGDRIQYDYIAANAEG